MSDDKRAGWVYEEQSFLRVGYPLVAGQEAPLFSERSAFQKVEVYATASHGKMLLNDDMVMVSERDEFVYHDMIAHIPLFVHPAPRRVLVIGGGDGGSAREVLRHTGVEQCVMVEIDRAVIDACRVHIPQTAGVFSHPRLDLRVEDGLKYVRETADASFDVVIVDSTEPIGPAQPLFGPAFYRDLYRVLAADGIVVSQGESPFYHAHEQRGLLGVVKDIFPVASIYNFTNLTYPGGLWSFTYGAKGLHPVRDFVPARVAASGLTFRYYNAEIHRAAFALPQFQRDNLQGLLSD